MTEDLPVFCVSSQAYQALGKGVSVPGFEDPDTTEIPQLIRHAKGLTVDRRSHACKRFLNEFLQEMHSLHFWSSLDKQSQIAYQEIVRDALTLLKKVFLPPPSISCTSYTYTLLNGTPHIC